MDYDILEAHDFDCSLLGASTLIRIKRPPKEFSYTPNLTLKMAHPNAREMVCANVDNCGIAQPDSRGSIRVDWERCPAVQIIRSAATDHAA
jgi:hypothetical protein